MTFHHQPHLALPVARAERDGVARDLDQMVLGRWGRRLGTVARGRRHLRLGAPRRFRRRRWLGRRVRRRVRSRVRRLLGCGARRGLRRRRFGCGRLGLRLLGSRPFGLRLGTGRRIGLLRRLSGRGGRGGVPCLRLLRGFAVAPGQRVGEHRTGCRGHAQPDAGLRGSAEPLRGRTARTRPARPRTRTAASGSTSRGTAGSSASRARASRARRRRTATQQCREGLRAARRPEPAHQGHRDQQPDVLVEVLDLRRRLPARRALLQVPGQSALGPHPQPAARVGAEPVGVAGALTALRQRPVHMCLEVRLLEIFPRPVRRRRGGAA